MTNLELIQTAVTVIAATFAAIASFYAFRLHRLRIRFEKDAKNIQDQQKRMVQEISEFGRQLLTQTLKAAPQYAFAPYPQLMPSVEPSEMSLFDLRRLHFSPEKQLLAQTVVTRLSRQIAEDEKLSIILILDAGSTVFPVFRKLCTHPTFQFDRTNARRLKIITNNLPGVSDLTKYGRIGERRVARTLFRCRILRGYAHSEYEAALGDQTAGDLVEAVGEFKTAIHSERPSDTIKVVSVTTGNYVSIADGILARSQYHIETKSTMLEIGDDIFTFAPLGKLLPYSCDEINNLLDLQGEEGYSTLTSWDTTPGNLMMVVTTRNPSYFPELRPVVLNGYFAHVQKEVCEKWDEDHLISVRFDPMDDAYIRTQASIIGSERALREFEIPHPYLREALVQKLEAEAQEYQRVND